MFPKLEAVPLAGVAVVLLFFVVGWEAMGHSVHFIVNHRNLLLFILITLPEIPCLSVSTRLSHKFLGLSIAAYVILALQNGTLRSLTYCPALPPCLLLQRHIRLVTLMSFSNLSLSSNFLTQALLSSWALVASRTDQSRG